MKRRPAQSGGSGLQGSLRRAAPAALLILAACGRDKPEPVGEPGAGEAQALAEAAEMLEEQRHETTTDERAEPAAASPSPPS